MKQAVPFLLLTFFICSCRSPFFSVATKNGGRADYQIVSVRDSSLVLLPRSLELSPEAIRASATVIPFDSIEDVKRLTSSGIGEIVLGGFVGGFSALMFGVSSDHSTVSTNGASTGVVAWSVAGGLIGWLLKGQEQDMFPAKTHTGELRAASYYGSEEPAWLQQIR